MAASEALRVLRSGFRNLVQKGRCGAVDFSECPNRDAYDLLHGSQLGFDRARCSFWRRFIEGCIRVMVDENSMLVSAVDACGKIEQAAPGAS
jgi:hypothetical protein